MAFNYDFTPIEPRDFRIFRLDGLASLSEIGNQGLSFMQGFNRRWKAENLKVVYVAYNAPGAQHVTTLALNSYEPGQVRILSGGHSYENFVFNENTMAIINVTGLMEYGKDPEKGFYVSTGDTNWNSFKNLFRDFGKILPGGSCYSVGLGGHICGGGDGILSRLYGLTSDHLTGLEIVVKPSRNGEAVLKYVTADSGDQDEKDLFWAHTGAGPGNFGVVTKYFFRTLPDAPLGFICSYVTFSWDKIDEGVEGLDNLTSLDAVHALPSSSIKAGVDRFEALLNWYWDLAMSEPSCEDPYNWHTVGKFPVMHKAAGEFVLYLYTSYYNKEQLENACLKHDTFEQQLNELGMTTEPTRVQTGGHGGILPFPLRSRQERRRLRDGSLDPTDETLNYPTYEMVQTMNASGANQRGKYKSAYYIKKMPRHQIETVYKFLHYTPPCLQPKDMTQSLLQMDMFGGQIREKCPDDTASAQRSYHIKFQYQTYWLHQEDDQHHLDWISEFYNHMYAPYGGAPDPKHPCGIFEGCYFNYPDVDLNCIDEERGKYKALDLYFIDNVPKLIATKNRWDPNDFFQNCQSIPPQTEEQYMQTQNTQKQTPC